ncbi:hypothetical protein FA13DRAFT_294698 [Coprinellus micaceus]|uniref:Uncharacterized protein n=1 Tax=Coprinellus micaceus TaxID=71717 RepID=A0A4Y7SET0_COPMI|nr:hypothetical protein FA13DRAFT_294698 [Coprinellus micaceus]
MFGSLGLRDPVPKVASTASPTPDGLSRCSLIQTRSRIRSGALYTVTAFDAHPAFLPRQRFPVQVLVRPLAPPPARAASTNPRGVPPRLGVFAYPIHCFQHRSRCRGYLALPSSASEGFFGFGAQRAGGVDARRCSEGDGGVLFCEATWRCGDTQPVWYSVTLFLSLHRPLSAPRAQLPRRIVYLHF